MIQLYKSGNKEFLVLWVPTQRCDDNSQIVLHILNSKCWVLLAVAINYGVLALWCALYRHLILPTICISRSFYPHLSDGEMEAENSKWFVQNYGSEADWSWTWLSSVDFCHPAPSWCLRYRAPCTHSTRKEGHLYYRQVYNSCSWKLHNILQVSRMTTHFQYY